MLVQGLNCPGLVMDCQDLEPEEAELLLGIAEMRCTGAPMDAVVKEYREYEFFRDTLNRLKKKRWVTWSNWNMKASLRVAKQIVWREVCE